MSMPRNAQNPYVQHAMPSLILLARTFDVENCATSDWHWLTIAPGSSADLEDMIRSVDNKSGYAGRDRLRWSVVDLLKDP